MVTGVVGDPSFRGAARMRSRGRDRADSGEAGVRGGGGVSKTMAKEKSMGS